MYKDRLPFVIVFAVLIGAVVGALIFPTVLSTMRPASVTQPIVSEEKISALNTSSSPTDVVNIMVKSPGLWASVHAVIDAQYSAPNPYNETQEVWLANFNQARVVMTTRGPSAAQVIAVSDGKQYTIYNTISRAYYAQELPSDPRAKATSIVPPPPPPAGAVVSPHPLTGLIPSIPLEYLIPTSFGQSLRNEKALIVIGTERIASRDTLILEAQIFQNGQVIRRQKFWVDQTYGLVLNAQHFANDSKTWFRQVTVRQIDFNASLPPDLFRLQLPSDATKVTSPLDVLK